MGGGGLRSGSLFLAGPTRFRFGLNSLGWIDGWVGGWEGRRVWEGRD